MILPFSTKMNGKPTYFVEKIWETILQKGIQIKLTDFIEFGRKALPKHYIVGTHKPKLHTIREDKKDRWKAGTKIDFFINCRQKDMFRFAPVLPVVSIQNIEIIHTEFMNDIIVTIDGKRLNTSGKQQLAYNDGFESLMGFLLYFNEDFKGKIIHWTDLRY